MRSLGKHGVYLEVRESNLGAIAFYERLGFSSNGRRNNYYRNPDEAAVCMKKILTG
jgi:ribosomal-protein-alanine N-acetyltransferase